MKLVKDAHRSDEPQDEMTKLAARLITAVEKDHDFDGCQVIVIVDRGMRGGMGATGFDPDTMGPQVLTNLLGHIQAVGQTMGINIGMLPLESKGRG